MLWRTGEGWVVGMRLNGRKWLSTRVERDCVKKEQQMGII